MNAVIVVDHPAVQDRLTTLRRRETPPAVFRATLREIARFLAYEATRTLPIRSVPIETPMAPMDAPVFAEPPPIVLSILRAGNGLLDGVLDVIPHASGAFLGLARDHVTLQPIEYCWKVPEQVAGRPVFVVDPMLATGNSAVAAIERIRALGPSSVTLIALVAAPPGVARVHEVHPDVPIVVAAVDPILDHRGYIVPGLGDAGDRIWAT